MKLEQALQDVYGPIEAKLDALLQQRFSAAEFEIPCLLLLRSLFPGAEVEHTSGPSEHGADLVVTWEDPLTDSGTSEDLSFRTVFQVKNWHGQARDLHAIDQLVEAIRHYQTDYPVRGALPTDALRWGGASDAKLPRADEQRAEHSHPLHRPQAHAQPDPRLCSCACQQVA